MEERIVGLIPRARKPKSFGRWDTYTVIVTNKRCIFALLTSQMLQSAAKEAQERGKAEGKGFFARWGAQIAGHMNYHERYREMSPAAVLAENGANFALDHSAVRVIKVKRSGSLDDDTRSETELKFEGPATNLSIKLDGHDRRVVDLLRDVFGDRVKV